MSMNNSDDFIKLQQSVQLISKSPKHHENFVKGSVKPSLYIKGLTKDMEPKAGDISRGQVKNAPNIEHVMERAPSLRRAPERIIHEAKRHKTSNKEHVQSTSKLNEEAMKLYGDREDNTITKGRDKGVNDLLVATDEGKPVTVSLCRSRTTNKLKVVIWDNFRYSFPVADELFVRWRCTAHGIQKCYAKLLWAKEDDWITLSQGHNHKPLRILNETGINLESRTLYSVSYEHFFQHLYKHKEEVIGEMKESHSDDTKENINFIDVGPTGIHGLEDATSVLRSIIKTEPIEQVSTDLLESIRHGLPSEENTELDMDFVDVGPLEIQVLEDETMQFDGDKEDNSITNGNEDPLAPPEGKPVFSKFTTEERAHIIELYHSGNSFRVVRDIFASAYQDRPIPSISTIHEIVKKFNKDGSASCAKKKRKPHVITEAVELDLRCYVEENRTSSLASLSKLFRISRSSVRNILMKYEYKSYKYGNHQILDDHDKISRTDFCETLFEMLNNDETLLNRIIFTDEATFGINGAVNSQNYRNWYREDKPPQNFTPTQNGHNVNVWVGIVNDRLIGPFFIDRHLNGDKFITLLRNHIMPMVVEMGDNLWFQMDGAPAHTTRAVSQFMTDAFENRWIGKFGPIHWPARSPDLSPNDFFLWGYLKTQVFTVPIKNIKELKGRISNACNELPRSLIRNSVRGFQSRLAHCLEQEGGHFEYLL